MNESSAAALESKVSANPNDLGSGFSLLGYYWARASRTPLPETRHKFVRQMEWAIEHAPESPALSTRNLHFQFNDFPNGSDDYPRIVALWNKQILSHPGSTAILHNAVMSFFAMPISVSFADQLRKSDPYDVDGVLPYAIALGSILVAVQDDSTNTPGNAGLAKLGALTVASFKTTNDAALVGTTGKSLTDLAVTQPGRMQRSAQQDELLLQRAHAIDPQNPKWTNPKGASPSASLSGTEVDRLYRWLEEEDLWPGRIVPAVSFSGNPIEVSAQEAWQRQYMRVFGRDVDVATMAVPGAHKNAQPEMPSERDGSVTLDLLINEQGLISRVVPMSGDAEHIEIAEESLDRWRFHPWLVNGKPVIFHTKMLITYRKSLWGVAGGVFGVGTKPVMNSSPFITGSAENVGEIIGGSSPVYPVVAKAARVEGVVVLKAVITEKGTVVDISLVSGPPLLVKAAIDAVSTWTYKPFLKDGRPIRIGTQITVVFSLGAAPDRKGAPLSVTGPDPSRIN